MANSRSIVVWGLYGWLLGLVILLLVRGSEIVSVLSNTLDTQIAINKNVSQVNSTFVALVPTIENWNKTFTGRNDIKDVVSLYKALNIESTGLISTGTDLREGSVDSVMYKGKDLGLITRCIKNGGRGFSVHSTSLSGLLNGLERLEDRKDITWGSVHIGQNAGKTIATFDELCVYIRIEDK